ncbi:MAG: cell wall hydrolase/autolysin [Firmicutes bacterium]|nr:cell wall hydrolase/autolysin [Bacillota bacterium]
MRIAINGGHCPGKDSGAVGETGLQEAYVTHDLMQLLSYYLQQANFETIQIQENELQEICDQSNQFGAELFLSIHCNSAESRDAQGTETFCLTTFSEAGNLARYIQSQIVSSLGTVDRGVKVDRFYVLRHTDCPAVLIECAFISNSDDEILLASEQGRDDIVHAIARGITDYVAK